MFRDHRLAQRDGGLARSLLLTYGDGGRKYVKPFQSPGGVTLMIR